MKYRDSLCKCVQKIPLNANSSVPSAFDQASHRTCDMLPSFFVVGPPRTGTSWLHEVLNHHTNLPSPTKETRFFDNHFERGLNWYRAHFPVAVAGRPMGEIAPTYFASAQARERIAGTVPHAKLIFIFRNPVQRVISLYQMKRAYGMLSWSLEEALSRDPELLVSGLYATNLRKWQLAFPRGQMLIMIYDDLRKHPQSFTDGVCDFLGIPRILLVDSQLKRMHSSETMTEPRCYPVTRRATALAEWCKARRWDNVVAAVRSSVLMKLLLSGGAPFPKVSEDTLEKLGEIFRPEVDELEQITGRRLSAWKITGTTLSMASAETK